MKLSLLLLCATASAYPLQKQSTRSALPDASPAAALDSKLTSTVQQYVTRLRRESSAWFSRDEDSPEALPTPEPESDEPYEPLDETQHAALMHSFAELDQRHKELIAKAHPSRRNARSNPDIDITSDPDFSRPRLHEIIERHGPECVALVIFILAPITFVALSILGCVLNRCTRERFPNRGRDPVRLDGPEREARLLGNQERESLVLSEKSWWQASDQRR